MGTQDGWWMYRRQEVGRLKDWRCAAQVAGVQSQPMTRMAREPARGSRLSREANGWMICSQGQSSFARSWARLGCRVCGELQAVLRCDEDEKGYDSGVDSGGNLYCNVECIFNSIESTCRLVTAPPSAIYHQFWLPAPRCVCRIFSSNALLRRCVAFAPPCSRERCAAFSISTTGSDQSNQHTTNMIMSV
jgi:hypothetical protein